MKFWVCNVIVEYSKLNGNIIDLWSVSWCDFGLDINGSYFRDELFYVRGRCVIEL